MLGRVVPWCFAVAGMGCFVLAGYLAFYPPQATPGCVVEQPERCLDGLLAGRDYEVEYRVHNRTGSDLRVVGAGLS
jgi:hypothetical protein